MGCSSSNAVTKYENSDIDIQSEINQQKMWSYFQNKILNKFTTFIKENKYSNNIKIGFYERITYTKLQNVEKCFTWVSKKVFVKYGNTKHKNEVKSFMNEYFNKHKKYLKYYSNENECCFTIENIMNINCVELGFNNKQKEIALCFVKIDTLSYKDMSNLFKIWELKNKNVLFIVLGNYNNNKNDNDLLLTNFEKEINAFINSTKVIILKDQNLIDKYNVFNKYTIFLNENKVHSWIESIYWNGSVPKLAKNNDDASLTLYQDKIKNIINSKQLTDEYEIIYQKYELFNASNSAYELQIFPIFISSNYNNDYVQEHQMQILFKQLIPKLDINNFIIQSIQEIVGDNIKITLEVFKEKKYSILYQKAITIKKQYTVILNISSEFKFHTLTQTKEFIINKLNPFLKHENNSYSITHLVVMPSLGMKRDSYLTTTHKGILIFRESNCLEYINETLINTYKNNYNKLIDTFVISETNSNNDNDEIYEQTGMIYIDNSSKVNSKNENVSCYFYSFNNEAYNAHLFLIQNQDKIIYCDFFRNSNCVYFKHINNSTNENNMKLECITLNDFKNKVKTSFNNVINDYQNNVNSFLETISYNEIFSTLRNNMINDQPLISLKYNKIINNSNNTKQYKNYSVNYVTTLSFDNPLESFPQLNEISKIYYTNDSYVNFNKERVKCQECNDIIYGKVTNIGGIIPCDQFSLYLCPITKSPYCVDCVNKGIPFENVYNLLYIQSTDQMIMNSISQNNISNFKCIEQSKQFTEIKENNCDVCMNNIMNGSGSKNYFYSLINVINRNLPCFVCNVCFEILTDYNRKFEIDVNYDYIKRFVQIHYVDLNNLVFKKIIVE